MKEIISENKGKIRAIIRRMTGSYNEDVEQEIYIKAWRNLDNYKEEGKFSHWLGVIAANVCRDYFKSKQYKDTKKEIVDDELVESIATEHKQEDVLDAKDRQKEILKAVNSLPQKMRIIVELFEFEEMTYEDISSKLGIPIGTVKSRLSNARKILSEKLKHLKENK